MKTLLIISLSILYSASMLAEESNWTPKYVMKSKDEVKTKSSAIGKPKLTTNQLSELYKNKYSTKQQFSELKDKTLSMTQDAVPVLTNVIKSSQYPENNRWIAMFMLGRIMGKKSAPFISKFSNHPNWMLRLASLKVLLALDQDQYKGIYVKCLKDPAMIVRHQALENINNMKLKELAPYVWAMLYDSTNYAGDKGSRKRSHIIKQAVKTVGDLEFQDSRKPMLVMIQDEKYKDIFQELDYSLNKVSDKKSPDGDIKLKKHFWSRLDTSDKIIN